MFWYFDKFSKDNRGFTLLELIVVMAIFLIITSVVLTDIPSFREKSSLDLTVSEVATYVRGAQVYGAAQKGGGSGITTYTIKFTAGSSSFDLYKNDGVAPEESYKINGFKIGSILVDKADNLSCGSDVDNVSIMFNVNDYTSQIGTQLEPKVSVNNADCGNFSYVKMSIVSIRNPLSSQCIGVYRNGQITPASCTSL